MTPTEPIFFVRSISRTASAGSRGSMAVTHFSRSGDWLETSATQLL